MQFSNANVAFSLCSPSRAALLTGRYGSNNGVLKLGSMLHKGEISVANRLKDAGYTTGISGKWHIKQEPKSLGFDFYSYFRSNGTYYGRQVINIKDTVYPEMHVDKYGVLKSIEFLKKAKSTDKPFFLFHCPQTPHMDGKLEWNAKEETKQLYNVVDMPVPSNHRDNLNKKPPYLRKVRNLTQAKKYGYPDSLAIKNHVLDYYAVITELDGFLGVLFHEIEDLGLSKNTYIIFMSDNGWMLGDHGFTSKVLPYEPSTHVPFWIYGPNIKPSHNNSLVSNIDIFPTIMEMVGLDISKNIHGKSLYPIIKREKEKVRDYFVYEGLGTYGGAKPNLTIISEKFRYIKTYHDNSLEKVVFTELYNQKHDRDEIENLIFKSEYEPVIKKMDTRLEIFKRETLINTEFSID